MTIKFTEEELEYIDTEPFNWTVKEDAPKELKESIERKLNLLNSKS